MGSSSFGTPRRARGAASASRATYAACASSAPTGSAALVVTPKELALLDIATGQLTPVTGEPQYAPRATLGTA